MTEASGEAPMELEYLKHDHHGFIWQGRRRNGDVLGWSATWSKAAVIYFSARTVPTG